MGGRERFGSILLTACSQTQTLLYTPGHRGSASTLAALGLLQAIDSSHKNGPDCWYSGLLRCDWLIGLCHRLSHVEVTETGRLGLALRAWGGRGYFVGSQCSPNSVKGLVPPTLADVLR